MHSICVILSRSTAYGDKVSFRSQCILKSFLHEELASELCTCPYTLLRGGSYVCDHTASPRISVNEELSTMLNCLVSGKELIEWLPPTNLCTRVVTTVHGTSHNGTSHEQTTSL